MSEPLPKAVLAIDYQNMYIVSERHGRRFFVLNFVHWIKSMYIIKTEDVTIFMSRVFFAKMPDNAKRYVQSAGKVRLSCRIRTTKAYDPVDARIEQYLLKEIKRGDVTHILLASSDGGFAHLGQQAWHSEKKFHVFSFADPSKKFRTGSDQVIEIKGLPMSGIRR